MNKSVGMRSLAISFPRGLRTNDYWRQKYPEMVAAAEAKVGEKVWTASDHSSRSEIFDSEMAPFLSDPFRGAVERRALTEGESALSIELQAARDALKACQAKPTDIDLIIAASFWPDKVGIGNATFLAKELGLQGGAWNLETACSGAMIGFQTACALVRSEEYRNVLVVVSCTYSRNIEDSDSMSWFSGDGAGAFVISSVEDTYGLLGTATIHTGETCNAFLFDAIPDPVFGQKFRLRSNRSAGLALRETAEEYVHKCCEKAAHSAGVNIKDINFFVFNTPTAWYSSFCARALGIDPKRTVDTYPQYANMGPALMPVNLYTAAQNGKIKRGDLVMIYSVGSVSSAGAAVVRWGDVCLGAKPERPVTTS